MAIALYFIGLVILMAGLAWAAALAGLSGTWIMIGLIIVFGAAIVVIASRVSRRPPDENLP